MAVSGGADSLYAMLALKERGHELMALHGRFLEHAPPCPPGLAEVCADIGAPLHVIDLRAQFRALVIEPFTRAYLSGQTPNPCINCNAAIKFGLLLDAAQSLGAARLATGHYAALAEHEVYGLALRAAADQSKDQSYFLALVPRERLERAVFPLSGLLKAQILENLRARGLSAPVSAESQDICFAPGNDYRALLEASDARPLARTQKAGAGGPPNPAGEAQSAPGAASGVNLPGPGPICLRHGGLSKEIGRHNGLWRYTEGQRRGLGIAHSEALYVIGKDTAENALLVGPREAALALEFRAGKINYSVPAPLWPQDIHARVRYRQKSAPAYILESGAEIRFAFREAQTLSAPGQAAVFYDAEGFVLGGGIILPGKKL